jgi:YVTN family beta-propeller protein
MLTMRSLRGNNLAAVASSLITIGAARAGAQPAPAAAGTLIVLNKAEGTASLIDLATGGVAVTLPTGQGPHEVAVSPDGRWAVVSNYGGETPGSTLTVLDLHERRVARTVDLAPARRPHGVSWLRGGAGRVAVTAEVDSAVLVVDVERGRVLRQIRTGQGVSHMVASAPDGAHGFVANIGSGSVTRVGYASGDTTTTSTGAGSEGIDVTPDGREVWVTNRAANTVSVVDARTMRALATLPSAAFPIRVKITPDGRRALVTNARSSELRVFDVSRRTPVATLRFPLDSGEARGTLLGEQFAGSAVPIGVLVAPDGSRAFVATAATDQIAEVDLATLKITRYLRAGREPDGLGFAPNAAR